MLRPGDPAYQFLHRAGELVHRSAARHPAIAHAYLGALSALRLLPDGDYKQRVINSVTARTWPALKLPVLAVTVGQHTQIRLRPHVGEFDFEALLSRRLQYERDVFAVLEDRMADYDAVIEIGANVGVYTAFFCQHQRETPSGPRPAVFAFEPSREAYARLLDNLAHNAGVATAFNCAVASHTGFMDFFEPAGHLTNGSLRADFAAIFSSDVARTTVATLDGESVLRLVGDAARVLLKIDVEGAEAEVLRSLAPMIARRRPDILIEVLAVAEAEIAAEVAGCGVEYAPHCFEHGLRRMPALACPPSGRDVLLVPVD
jgi:FkbM family methyltransferase